MNSKNLHKHALPVALLGVTLLVATVGLTVETSKRGGDLLGLLSKPVVQITPTSNGLAQVKLSDTTNTGSVKAVQALDIAVPLSTSFSSTH